jgi:CRISPR-associated protein Csb1
LCQIEIKISGNIIYHYQEYTAKSITAYFNLDLAQIRGYQLGETVENLLIAMAIWKIQRFLNDGLRLRTACDLECLDVRVTRPQNYELPSHEELTKALPKLVEATSEWFADPPVTEVQYQAEEKSKDKKK